MNNSLLLTILFALAAAGVGAATNDAAPLGEPLPGQIIIDPHHPEWLKRHGGGHVFICGPGDPEGFLYRGERKPDGTSNPKGSCFTFFLF